ncbi:MAG: PAS domain S-box protein, partial [Acidobacteriota bacterium]
MSAALDVSLNVLYVQGTRIEEDRAATDELRTASSELQITTIAGPAAALAELRRTPGWQALIVSPSIPHNETLALIASIRRDRIPIAIVPIIDDTHQEVFAAAVATGADDVLVRRGGTLVSIRESLTRIRQSPHLFPAEQRRRIVVLYAGRDPLVWNLLAQVPFVRAERAAVTPEGTCPVRRPGAGDDSLRADAVIIDEAPGDAHPLQVLKSVKAQASDVPVIVLTSAGGADIATAALELGADDTVLKTGIFRRRLIATLRRVHQRIEISAQQQETRAREERLRQIVENVPAGIMVVSGDGRVLAMNGAALQLFGASRPRDVVGRDFRDLAAEAARPDVGELIRKVTKGEPGSLDFDAVTLDGSTFGAHIDAVMLERDARGNRGLVAAIGRAGQPEASAELPALRAELERLERHYAELEEARTRERETWEAERRALLERLEATERAAAERDTLARRLEEISAELTRAGETFAAEREALEQQIRELEARTEQSSNEGALRLELERSLTQVRTELEQAIEAHAVERSGWEAIRADLEARIEELDQAHRSEHDSLVASLRSELTRLEGTLADERARWDDTRQQLEAELQRAREALWEEHRAHEATRAGYESDLASLRTQLDEARVDWETREASLRRELDDLRAEREA